MAPVMMVLWPISCYCVVACLQMVSYAVIYFSLGYFIAVAAISQYSKSVAANVKTM
jgi:hypothetical protein